MAESAFSSLPRTRRGASSLPEAPPVDEETSLRWATRNTLSGLGWLAGSLGKPQRALWGTVNGLTGGDWGGGGPLNLIPFSDTVGLTDPSMERSGSTTLERMGVLPKNTPGFDWWDVPRFGVDVATDPLTYVGGAGAFGKAGAAAKGTGFVDDAVRSTMARTGMGFRRSAAATTGRDVLKYASSVGHGRPATRAFVERARQLGVRARDIADQPIGGVGFRLPGTLGSAYRGPGARAIETALDAPGQFFRNVRRSAVGASAAELVDKAAQGAERNRFAEEAVREFGEGAREQMRNFDATAVRFAQQGSGTTEDYYRRIRAETVDAGNAAKPMAYTAKMRDGSSIPVDISPEGHYVDQMGRKVADDAVEEIGQPMAGATDTLFQGEPVFYSKLRRAVNEIPDGRKVTLQELEGSLKKKGVKGTEMEYADLKSAYGDSRFMTKDQIKQHLDKNTLGLSEEVIEDTALSGSALEDAGRLAKTYDDAFEADDLNLLPQSELDALKAGPVKDLYSAAVARREMLREQLSGEGGWADYGKIRKTTTNAKTLVIRGSGLKSGIKEGDQHYKDALGYVRFGDQVRPDGKKILHIENIQSDWAQQAEGAMNLTQEMAAASGKYADEMRALEKALFEEKAMGGARAALWEQVQKGFPPLQNMSDDALEAGHRTLNRFGNTNTKALERAGMNKDAIYEAAATLGEEINRRAKAGTNVATKHPFGKNWYEPMMRRVMRYAADNGYDGVSWSSAAEQAKRWQGGNAEYFKILYDEKIPSFMKKEFKSKIDNVLPEMEGPLPANASAYGPPIIPGAKGVMFDDAIRGQASRKQSLFQSGRAAVTFDDAAKTAVIKAFRGTSDISSFVHESAHVFRRWLDEVDPELLDELTKHFGMKSGAKWTREAEEKFAEAFEKYIAEGKAPKGFLQKSFDRLKEFLEEVYAGIKGSPLEKELDPKLKEAFDRMLSPADSPGVWTNSKIGNVARGLFDAASGGRFDRVGQEVNQIADAAMRRDGPKIAETFERMVESIRQPFKDFEEWFGPGFNNVAKGGMREGDRVSVAGRQGEINRLMPTKAEVFFRDPKTGLEEWKHVPLDQIVADTGKALQSSRLYSSFGKIAEAIGEGVDPDQAIKLVEEAMKLRPGTLTSRTLTDKVRNGMIEAAQKLQMERDTPFGSWLAKGGQSNFLDNHVPRAPDGGDIASISASRQAITKSIPGIVINKMLVDKSLRGDPVAAAQALMDKYITPGIAKMDNDYVSALRKDATGKQATGAQVHLEDLVGYINDHDKKWMYIRDFMANNARYTRDVVRANAIADGVHEMVKRSATPTGDVSLRQLFLSSSLDPDRALAWHSKLTGKSVAELEKLRVPLEVATGLSGIAQLQGNKEWFNVITKAIDKFHKLFKEAVTIQPAFIGYFTRNHAGGQFMNMASGNIEGVKDVLAYSKEYGRAVKEIKNGFKDVTDAELKEIQRYRVLGDTGFEGVEHYQAAPPDPLAWGSNVDQVRPGNPRALRETLREARQDVASSPTSLGEFTGKYPRIGGAIERGTDKVRTAWQANVRTGSKMNTNVEWLNRVTYYRFLRKKGFSAKAAADEVHKAHFDYSRLSPFERDVMKRAIPFYSFSRRMAEALFENLMERPGGAMAQTLSASAGVAEPGTPDHVATTAAIPMGELPDGSKRYLTGFGMPYEDTAGFFSGGVRGALLEGLSRSSPLIKGPMEWATGESFFQTGPGGGRDLLDADPPIGRAISNIAGWDKPVRLPEGIEHIAANLPTSRYTTLLRTMTDQRKGYGTRASQLLTGVRITDVSPAAQDAVLREHLTDAARRAGAGAFSRVSFDTSGELTPDQQQLQNALNALARRAKLRKKQKDSQEKKK